METQLRALSCAARIIRQVKKGVSEGSIDPDAADEELQSITRSLFACVPYVSMVESATSVRAPVGLQSAVEALVKQIDPGAKLLLRPKPNLGYGCLARLPDVIPALLDTADNTSRLFGLDPVDVEGILDAHGHRLVVISFPSLERAGLLHHACIGHELGHFLIEARECDERIAGQLEKCGTDITQAVDEVRPGLSVGEFAVHASSAAQVWDAWLRETLADIAACWLMGPAALGSLLAVALATGERPMYSDVPRPPFTKHPHVVYRVMVMLDELKEFWEVEWASAEQAGEDHLSEVGRRLRALHQRCQAFVSTHYKRMEEPYATVYEHALSAAKGLKTQLFAESTIQYRVEKFAREVPDLAEKISARIIPLEVGFLAGPERKSSQMADWRSILNAGLLMEPQQVPLTGAMDKQETGWSERFSYDERLLRAVEKAELARQYEDSRRRMSRGAWPPEEQP
ncbi:MAG: hypothetical protein ABIE42_06710 [Candidatus Eisenbacteria bacterium]